MKTYDLMRVAKRILSLFILTFCLRSCVSRNEPLELPAGVVNVELKVLPSNPVSRSSLVADDGVVSDYNLYLYRRGRLEWHLYRDSSGPVSVPLLESETYSVYAVANVGRMDNFPSEESEVAGIVCNAENFLSGMAAGIPLASEPGLTVHAGEGAAVCIPMTRLAARYSFAVDCSGLRYGDFEVTSIRLRQAANSASFFTSGSRASSVSMVSDGDYASSEDVAAVNLGASIYLYVLENMQGTLLPGNTDPWMKEYFNSQISDRKALCTYLEVCGRYVDNGGGLTAENTYRMYLGSDAVTNFDIRRNSSYTLTLAVSDEGAYRESWKVDRDELDDSRMLRFEPEYLTVPSLSSASTTLVASPSGTDFEFDWDSVSWSSAHISQPVISGNRVTVSNEFEVDEDIEVVLRAGTFDGLKTAVCTLKVLAPVLLDLNASWLGEIPHYVAQAGVIRCEDVPQGAVLTAETSDASVTRVIRSGNDFRVEALKEGHSTVTVNMSAGSGSVSKTFDLDVNPVFLQVAGRSYEAFADGGANAVRCDIADGSRWSIGYDIDRSLFDDSLYEELLAPEFIVTREGESAGLGWFSVNESGLYVSNWGGDVANVLGRFTLTANPRAGIYSDGAHPVSAEVIVNSPYGGLASLAFAGENRYYMPEPGSGCEISASFPYLKLPLGNLSNMKICITERGYAYGVGSSFVECPFRYDAQYSKFVLSPSYEAVLDAYPGGMYQFRGNSLRVYASVTNQLSRESSSCQIGTATIHLGLAVCTKLERWDTDDECDGDGDYFLIPCLYWERLENGMVSLETSINSGSGPFVLPRSMIAGMPYRLDLSGADFGLADYYYVPGRLYSPYHVHDHILGARSCFNLTLYSYYVLGYGEALFDTAAYERLENMVGNWVDIKCGWTLYDPFKRAAVPDGGYFDIDVRNEVKCFLRIHDCSTDIGEEYFDE